MTNENFVTFLNAKLAGSGLNQTQFAQKFGVKRGTFQCWLHGGVKKDGMRQAAIQKYPELFLETNAEPQPSPRLHVKADPLRRGSNASSLRVAINTELARHHIGSLSGILVQFLFGATSAERDRFRDELGDTWKDFLSLTRAMTGETALIITKDEGSLQKWGQ